MRRASCLALLLLALPDAADAYCRQTTKEGECTGGEPWGEELAWPTHCMGYSINEAGSSALPFETVRATLRASFAAWENATREGATDACTDFRYVEMEPTACDERGHEGACGRENVVVFRDAGWVDEWAHDRAAIALTTVYFDICARIVSTDLELNEEFYRFDTRDSYEGCEEEEGGCPVDLQNTVTHEAGHVLGLGHVRDTDATMDFAEVPGDTNKRTLEADDVAGVCDIYPVGEGSGECQERPRPCEPGGCCRVAAEGPPAAGEALVFLAGILIALRAARGPRWSGHLRDAAGASKVADRGG